MPIYVSSLLVLVAGLLIYALTKPDNPKVAEIGRIMFAMGLLAFLLTYVSPYVPMLHR